MVLAQVTRVARRTVNALTDGLRGASRSPGGESGRVARLLEDVANSTGSLVSAPARAVGMGGSPIVAGLLGVAILYVLGRTFLPNMLPVAVNNTADQAARSAGM